MFVTQIYVRKSDWRPAMDKQVTLTFLSITWKVYGKKTDRNWKVVIEHNEKGAAKILVSWLDKARVQAPWDFVVNL